MKAQILNLKGEHKGETELPQIFNSKIREDVVTKVMEVQKFNSIHPYNHALTAGKRHSASGTISHKRHEWKGHYGKGMSRAPRKVMWRRGTQFFWVAAEVNFARGGRRAHGPVGVDRHYRKINKKELLYALSSAIASTANEKLVKKRYSSLAGKNFAIKLPVVLHLEPSFKTKEFLVFVKSVFQDASPLAMKTKEVRAGKGKTRGRKYKSNAGLLLIKGKDENIKLSGIDIVSVRDLKLQDLYPLGRLTIYTQKALEELK